MTYCTYSCHCDRLMDPWNVCMYRAYTKEWCGFNSEHYYIRTILLCMPCMYVCMYVCTGHTQKNGAVLIVNTITSAPFFCVCPVCMYVCMYYDDAVMDSELEFESVRTVTSTTGLIVSPVSINANPNLTFTM